MKFNSKIEDTTQANKPEWNVMNKNKSTNQKTNVKIWMEIKKKKTVYQELKDLSNLKNRVVPILVQALGTVK